MRDWISTICLSVIVLMQVIPLHAAEKGELAEQFVNPPGEYRSTVLWEWCNGWLSKEAATAELESMARVGLGGAKVFNVGGPEGPVRFASPEWYEIFAHALRESTRLGLQLSMNMTEGFCAIGGPWITRNEYAACRLERDGSQWTGQRFDCT